MAAGTVKVGPDWELENQATEILMQDRRTTTPTDTEKNLWLTDDQMRTRWNHEVYTWLGYPMPSIRSGLFRRAYNPLAGQRPTGLSRESDFAL